jgi:5-methylcytosine-specific restriction endonuclease McrA
MFKKGQKAWNSGLKMSKETIDKISKSLKGRKAWNKGKKRWWKSPSEFKKGDNSKDKHYNWKGGISRGYKTGYYSSDYIKWRLSVFERDHFTCQVCNQVGGYLTAHHIKSFAHYPELRFVIDNGVTLCEECHKQTDNYMGRGTLRSMKKRANSGKPKA